LWGFVFAAVLGARDWSLCKLDDDCCGDKDGTLVEEEGAEEVGAPEDGEDFGELDEGEEGDDEEGEEEGAVIVGEEKEEEELGDTGAAASASVSESSILNRGRTKLDTGPVITRKAESDATTTIDSARLCLLILSLLLSLLSSLLLSSFLLSSGPIIY
jgi:hypothetical protein